MWDRVRFFWSFLVSPGEDGPNRPLLLITLWVAAMLVLAIAMLLLAFFSYG